MISVIICSVNPALALQVKRNIGATIGVLHEIIISDNRNTGKGICQVYNEGARQSRYDILCFVHEDVLFETNGWGRLIAGYFGNDPSLGVVGLAGSKYKSRAPSGWATGLATYDCSNILHIDNTGHRQKLYVNPGGNTVLEEVVTIDGVFMCARREAWHQYPFNEKVLKGFHFYDLDFSLSVGARFKLGVTYEMDLVHFTEGGDFGDKWLSIAIPWHRLCQNKLPRSTSHVSELENLERTIAKKWLHRLKGEKISMANRLRWIKASRCWRHPFLWPHAALFFAYGFLKN